MEKWQWQQNISPCHKRLSSGRYNYSRSAVVCVSVVHRFQLGHCATQVPGLPDERPLAVGPVCRHRHRRVPFRGFFRVWTFFADFLPDQNLLADFEPGGPLHRADQPLLRDGVGDGGPADRDRHRLLPVDLPPTEKTVLIFEMTSLSYKETPSPGTATGDMY